MVVQVCDDVVRRPCRPDCRVCGALRDAVADVVARTGMQQLTLADLARGAGVPEKTAIEHSPTGITPHLVAAYLAANDRYFDVFSTSLLAAPSWDAAIRESFRALADELARRPAVANLCLVEILRVGRDLLGTRVGLRQRYVELLAGERARRSPEAEPIPAIQFELLVGAASYRVSSLLVKGRPDEIPQAIEDVLETAGVVEPLAA